MKIKTGIFSFLAAFCFLGAGLSAARAVDCADCPIRMYAKDFKFPLQNASLIVVFMDDRPNPISVTLQKDGKDVYIGEKDLDSLAVYDNAQQQVYNRWFFREEGLIYYDAIMSIYPEPTPYDNPAIIPQLEGIRKALDASRKEALEKADKLMMGLEDAQGGLETQYEIVAQYSPEPSGKVVRKQRQRVRSLHEDFKVIKSKGDAVEVKEIKALVGRIEQELNAATRLEQTFSNMR
ncbi:MAG: hypothetical protein HY611_08160 [Elusimicrobia bacterium]|nr:hypothetical protein [Elusimicrobiota bacterium]